VRSRAVENSAFEPARPFAREAARLPAQIRATQNLPGGLRKLEGVDRDPTHRPAQRTRSKEWWPGRAVDPIFGRKARQI